MAEMVMRRPTCAGCSGGGCPLCGGTGLDAGKTKTELLLDKMKADVDAAFAGKGGATSATAADFGAMKRETSDVSTAKIKMDATAVASFEISAMTSSADTAARGSAVASDAAVASSAALADARVFYGAGDVDSKTSYNGLVLDPLGTDNYYAGMMQSGTALQMQLQIVLQPCAAPFAEFADRTPSTNAQALLVQDVLQAKIETVDIPIPKTYLQVFEISPSSQASADHLVHSGSGADGFKVGVGTPARIRKFASAQADTIVKVVAAFGPAPIKKEGRGVKAEGAAGPTAQQHKAPNAKEQQRSKYVIETVPNQAMQKSATLQSKRTAEISQTKTQEQKRVQQDIAAQTNSAVKWEFGLDAGIGRLLFATQQASSDPGLLVGNANRSLRRRKMMIMRDGSGSTTVMANYGKINLRLYVNKGLEEMAVGYDIIDFSRHCIELGLAKEWTVSREGSYIDIWFDGEMERIEGHLRPAISAFGQMLVDNGTCSRFLVTQY